MLYYSLIILAGMFIINYYSIIPNFSLLGIAIIGNVIYLWSLNYSKRQDHPKHIDMGCKINEDVILPNSVKEKIKIKFILSLNMFLLSLLWCGYNYYQVIHEQWLLTQLFHKPVKISGYINSLTINKNILFKIDTIKINDRSFKFRYLFLNLKQNKDFQYNLRMDDFFQIQTLLKPSDLPANFIDGRFFGFYYNKIFVKSLGLDNHTVISHMPASGKLENIRQIIWDRFYLLSKQLNTHGIILALLFGERSHITDEQNKAFLSTGTGHLIAISGMHISLIFYLLMKVSTKIWPVRLYRMNYMAREKYAYILSWFVTLFYSYLSGFSVSNQRAFVAITIFCLCKLCHFTLSTFNIFGACLLFVLLLDPFVVHSAGFWLSFVATLWLLYFYCNRYNKPILDHKNRLNNLSLAIKENAISGVYMFVALIPITLFYFNKFSILSALANIVAIPIVNLLILPLSFLALFLLILNFTNNHIFLNLTYVVLKIVDCILAYLISFLSHVDNFYPAIFRYYNYYDTFSLLVLSVITIILLAPKGWPKIPIIGILNIFFYFNLQQTFVKNSGDLTIDVLDVGQGLSVLLNTKNHQLLYDTGPKLFGDYVAEKIVINSLLNYGKKLDTIVISHWDADHSANLPNILNNLKTRNIQQLFSSSIMHGQKVLSGFNSQLKTTHCNSNYAWNWDGVIFQFIKNLDNPDDIYLGNNSSCVLKVTSNNTSILLTGDIEAKTEIQLLDQHKQLLQATILLVPHHGSKTSSSYDFIKQVNPKYALISVANNNIYRLPNYAIISRYRDLGIKVYRTDQQGAIRVKVANDTVEFNFAKYHTT